MNFTDLFEEAPSSTVPPVVPTTRKFCSHFLFAVKKSLNFSGQVRLGQFRLGQAVMTPDTTIISSLSMVNRWLYRPYYLPKERVFKLYLRHKTIAMLPQVFLTHTPPIPFHTLKQSNLSPLLFHNPTRNYTTGPLLYLVQFCY